MKRTTFALLAGALLVAGLQTSVLAQSFAGLKDQLGLSDEQVTRLEKLRTDHQTAADKARAEMIKAEAEVLSLRVNPVRDLKAMEAAIKKVGDLRTAQQIASLRNQEACLQVLTPEQQQKVKALQGTGRGLMGFGQSGRMGGRAIMGGHPGGRMGGRAMMGGRQGRRMGGRAMMGGRNRPMMNRQPGRNIPPMTGQGAGQGAGAGMRGMMQGQGWQPGQMLRQFMGRRMSPPASTPPPTTPPPTIPPIA